MQNKFLIIAVFVLLLASGFFLVKYQNTLSIKNYVKDTNIIWSDEWESATINDEPTMLSIFPGSEFSFTFTDAKSIGFRVNTDDIENSTILFITIDGKTYALSNPNINDKRLSIVIPESKRKFKHEVNAKMYCIVGVSTCKVNISEIFLEEGSIITSEKKSEKKTIGILGDSLSLIELQNNYSASLADSFGYHLHNASYWGGTIGTDKGKFAAVSRYKKDLVKYKPDIVIIFLGINDVHYSSSPELFRRDYNQIVKGIKKDLPKTRILAVSILPGKDLDVNNDEIVAFNSIIKEIAQEQKINYVDATNWLNPDDYADQLHPNYKGEGSLAVKLRTYLIDHNIK